MVRYGLDSEHRADRIAVAEEYKSALTKLNLFSPGVAQSRAFSYTVVR